MFLQRNETNYSNNDLIFYSFLFQIFLTLPPLPDLQNVEREHITLLQEFLGTIDERYFTKYLKVNLNTSGCLVNLV